jgi:hypothetical protein
MPGASRARFLLSRSKKLRLPTVSWTMICSPSRKTTRSTSFFTGSEADTIDQVIVVMDGSPIEFQNHVIDLQAVLRRQASEA